MKTTSGSRWALNAYEIIKILESMNVKWWYNIADPTVYATLRTLDKKGLIVGASEKNGNMPFRTVYSISEKGKEELRDTLTKSKLILFCIAVEVMLIICVTLANVNPTPVLYFVFYNLAYGMVFSFLVPLYCLCKGKEPLFLKNFFSVDLYRGELNNTLAGYRQLLSQECCFRFII